MVAPHPMVRDQSLPLAPAADPEGIWAHADGAHPERVSAVGVVVLRD